MNKNPLGPGSLFYRCIGISCAINLITAGINMYNVFHPFFIVSRVAAVFQAVAGVIYTLIALQLVKLVSTYQAMLDAKPLDRFDSNGL